MNMIAATELKRANFVRVAEVWCPSSDQSRLTWSDGIYGDLVEFSRESQATTFEPHEGLPGLTWSARSPVLMHQLDAASGPFKRADAARRADLQVGLALPIVEGSECRGIVTLLAGGSGAQGAMEIWSPSDRRELGLSAGFYSQLDSLQRVSHFLKFPQGAGLPGQSWQARYPRLVSPLAESHAFLRTSAIRTTPLHAGLSIPAFRSAWDLDSVVVLLSSHLSPLADGMEIWRIDATDSVQCTAYCYAGARSPHNLAEDVSRPIEDAGLVGRVVQERWPAISHCLPDVDRFRAAWLTQHGLRDALAFPIFVGPALVAVVSLLFSSPDHANLSS